MDMVLVALTDDLHRQLDWSGSVLLLSLDLSAIFNMVAHELLTHHIITIGIHGTVLQGLCSFFKDRDRE